MLSNYGHLWDDFDRGMRWLVHCPSSYPNEVSLHPNKEAAEVQAMRLGVPAQVAPVREAGVDDFDPHMMTQLIISNMQLVNGWPNIDPEVVRAAIQPIIVSAIAKVIGMSPRVMLHGEFEEVNTDEGNSGEECPPSTDPGNP